VLLDVTSTVNGISSGNCFINNGAYGLTNVNAAVADFSGSWWGDPSGPTDPANPGGTGDKVSQAGGNVNYSGFLTSAPATCAPLASLDTPALALGNQLVGTTSSAHVATLSNPGGKTLSLGSIATAAPYSLDASGTCPSAGGSLAPGASCTVAVKFMPTAAGAVPGSVVITSDAASSPTSIPLSGTGVTGTQLLKNASFETDANHDKKPDSWTYANFNLLTDQRDCTTFKAGKCSLKLVGNGKAKTVSQTITKSGDAGDDFAFSLFSKALKVPAAATYRLTVSFFNGASLVGTQSLNFTAGTHAFKQVKGVFTAPAAYTKVVYKITFKAASGTVWFDPASLTWAP
jgi:hypothetical protein